MYEHHFDTNHRHICQTCKKAFPGEKWLVLHIREIHDVLVRIQRERGEKIVSLSCKTRLCYRVGICLTINIPNKRLFIVQYSTNAMWTAVTGRAQHRRSDECI
jgi:hypothetical protein